MTYLRELSILTSNEQKIVKDYLVDHLHHVKKAYFYRPSYAANSGSLTIWLETDMERDSFVYKIDEARFIDFNFRKDIEDTKGLVLFFQQKIVEHSTVWDDLDNKWYRHFSGSSAVAVDTETSGLQVGRDKIYSVQLGDEEENTVIVRFKQHNRPANLAKILASPDVQKIFHYCKFDMSMIHSTFGIEDFQNIFCTKIASKIVRTYSGEHSLKAVVQDLLGVELKKDKGSSPWFVPELSQAQLTYARNDVLYLIQARDKLLEYSELLSRTESVTTAMRMIPDLFRLYTQGFSTDIFGY